MKTIVKPLLAVFLLVFLASGQTPLHAAEPAQSSVDWQTWTDDVFNVAVAEQRYVILNLEAVWCHWCHVMDAETYSNAKVSELIEKHYLPVRVDHDARPDLAQRYRNYGWPATIVFAPDGTEIVKRAGYIAPDNFARLLQAIVDNPSPEAVAKLTQPTQFSDRAFLSESLKEKLLAKHVKIYDPKLGGLAIGRKFLDRGHVEYAMTMAALGDANEERMARKTIDASLALLDPAWGGAYQYSTFGDWQHPHFEKIMLTQAGYLRIYALAYAQWKDPRHLDGAREIVRYLKDFLLSPDGAFYTSQDADLVQGTKGTEFFALDDDARRAKGIPRIDTHVYSQENGWAIESIATLYEVTGDPAYLHTAVRAAHWVIDNRSLPGGGFRHDLEDVAGPYLGDTLAMGRAFLQLYRVTADREWLARAENAAVFIDAAFKDEEAGFLTASPDGSPISPVSHIEENVSMTRFANLLSHFTGKDSQKELAEHGMRYLATAEVALRRIDESSVLLADLELANDPAHYTVVGAKMNERSNELYNIALREPGWYKRIEWWDVDEGPLPNRDVQYPVLGRSAAFVCHNGRCSLPSFNPKDYREFIARLNRED